MSIYGNTKKKRMNVHLNKCLLQVTIKINCAEIIFIMTEFSNVCIPMCLVCVCHNVISKLVVHVPVHTVYLDEILLSSIKVVWPLINQNIRFST